MDKTVKSSFDESALAASKDDNLRYLIFSLVDEEYSIPLLDVREVIALTEATPIPYAPAYFKGLINLRGQIISIIDLRTKLNLTKAAYGPEASIILLNLEDLSLGVIVDSVNCVLTFRPEEMSPAPAIGGKESCIKSVARKDKRLILNLDIEATLNFTDKKMISSQNLKAAA